ncbi:MAG: hypothetical protein K0R62_6250 [Nonomuraea muscovyensis]|jgi:hypothetical protein|nr:hypothetical protein [Nonomuraea muscovyensis]
MSNPTAAKVAAAAAQAARQDPTPANIATANAIAINAVRAGATGHEIQQAVQNNR